MSFFDQVINTVENQRFLEAVQDTKPVVLGLDPIPKSAKLNEFRQSAAFSCEHALNRETTLNWCFLNYLKKLRGVSPHIWIDSLANIVEDPNLSVAVNTNTPQNNIVYFTSSSGHPRYDVLSDLLTRMNTYSASQFPERFSLAISTWSAIFEFFAAHASQILECAEVIKIANQRRMENSNSADPEPSAVPTESNIVTSALPAQTVLVPSEPPSPVSLANNPSADTSNSANSQVYCVDPCILWIAYAVNDGSLAAVYTQLRMAISHYEALHVVAGVLADHTSESLLALASHPLYAPDEDAALNALPPLTEPEGAIHFTDDQDTPLYVSAITTTLSAHGQPPPPGAPPIPSLFELPLSPIKLTPTLFALLSQSRVLPHVINPLLQGDVPSDEKSARRLNLRDERRGSVVSSSNRQPRSRLASTRGRDDGNEPCLKFPESEDFLLWVQLQLYLQRPWDYHHHFTAFRSLGRGAFGVVCGVQHNEVRALYAVKEMSKRMIKSAERGYEWMVMNERRMLKAIKSPFVLSLVASLHDKERLYLFMDLCLGGDLQYHLRQSPENRFPLARARHYACQVLLGLERLHALGIAYRDLKPANVLLDQHGQAKLSDLGLCVRVGNKPLRHVAGTAGYWAPEIIARKGTFLSSDYWSFGVMLFEMLCGHKPRLRTDVWARRGKELLKAHRGKTRKPDAEPLSVITEAMLYGVDPQHKTRRFSIRVRPPMEEAAVEVPSDLEASMDMPPSDAHPVPGQTPQWPARAPEDDDDSEDVPPIRIVVDTDPCVPSPPLSSQQQLKRRLSMGPDSVMSGMQVMATLYNNTSYPPTPGAGEPSSPTIASAADVGSGDEAERRLCSTSQSTTITDADDTSGATSPRSRGRSHSRSGSVGSAAHEQPAASSQLGLLPTVPPASVLQARGRAISRTNHSVTRTRHSYLNHKLQRWVPDEHDDDHQSPPRDAAGPHSSLPDSRHEEGAALDSPEVTRTRARASTGTRAGLSMNGAGAGGMGECWGEVDVEVVEMDDEGAEVAVEDIERCIALSNNPLRWSPFDTSTRSEEGASKDNGILDVDIDYNVFADCLTVEAVDLLVRLFDPDPATRLGAHGVDEIKMHPFFTSAHGGLLPVDWDAMEGLRVMPPYKPDQNTVHAKTVDQLGGFDEGRFRHVRLTKEDDAIYEKWDYVNRKQKERDLVKVLDHLEHTDKAGQPKGCCSLM